MGRKNFKKQIGAIKKIYEKNFDREKFIKWKKQKKYHPKKNLYAKKKKTRSGQVPAWSRSSEAQQHVLPLLKHPRAGALDHQFTTSHSPTGTPYRWWHRGCISAGLRGRGEAGDGGRRDGCGPSARRRGAGAGRRTRSVALGGGGLAWSRRGWERGPAAGRR